MAFKLLRSVLATIAHDIADDFKYILGRLFSRGGHSSFPFLIGNQQVNWENYNYPPFLRLLHYELNDVEDVHARRATFFAHLAFVVGVGSCLGNLGGTIILALGGVHGKAVTIVYSTFNVVIFAVAGLYSFYMCYKGLVTTNPKFSLRYLCIQPVFICAFVAFSIVSGSNYNGWLNLAKSRRSKQLSGFWYIWTITESCLWSFNVVLSCTALLYVSLTRREGRPLGTPPVSLHLRASPASSSTTSSNH